jgi:hypothetical protein
MRNVTDTVGDENIFSASGHKGASRQKQRTSQHYQAELPSEESAGGGQEGRQALSFLIALDGESKPTTDPENQTTSISQGNTPRNLRAWANSEQAPKQRGRTSQYYLAELPSEEPKGGEWEGRLAFSSLHIAKSKENQRASQDLHAATDYKQQTKGAEKQKIPCRPSAWNNTSGHRPLQVGDSSLYLTQYSTAQADLEGPLIQDAMPSLENKYNHQGLVSRKSSLSVPQDQNRHVCIRNYSSSFCEKKASNTSLASERFVVKQEKSRPSGDSLEVVGMGSTVKSPVGSFKSGLSLCMWWIHILIALAVASTDGRTTIFADAAFAPRSRTELQGDGGSNLGVFGCVGSCGQSPLRESSGYNYCSTGDWRYSGTGNPCNNANTDVPNGQGTGTYGTMGSWDVSKVDNMRWSKCSLLDFIIANPVYCNILSSRSCLSSACDVIS